MTWLTCRWSCLACRRSGDVRIPIYPGETRSAAAARETRRTREACLAGCTYQAVDTPSEDRDR